jgi:ribosomal protein L11 methylase PrmA
MLELTLHIGVGVDASYVGDILVDLGALCVTTRDRNAGTAAEQPIFNEPAPDGDVCQATGKTPVPWTEAVLTAFFPVTTSVEDVTMALLSDFEMPATPNLKIVNSSPVPDHILAKDWVAHVHQNFAAVLIGDLCVRAPWHKTASLDAGVRHELIIEPGQASILQPSSSSDGPAGTRIRPARGRDGACSITAAAVACWHLLPSNLVLSLL